MESTGKPEQVHISEATSNFLGDSYYLEEGDDVDGHKTYFVLGRRKDTSRQNSLSPGNNETSSAIDINYLNGVSISQSATNLSVIQPNVPPASPVGIISASLNPSPILSSRPRVSSLNRNTENSNQAKVRTPPKIIVTAKSLPKNLDSDDTEISCIRGNTNGESSKGRSYENRANKSSFKEKIRSWKVSKFLKKQEDSKKSETVSVIQNPDPIVVINVEQNGYQQLPVVIEASKPSLHTLDIPHKFHSTPKTVETCSYSPGQNSNFDDIIDVRSYISHSRSDISPFGRTGSCRSQGGKQCYDTHSQGGFQF